MFTGQARAWEETYFLGSRSSPLDDFFCGEADEAWERFCTATHEASAAEGLMMPGVLGIERLLETFGTSWSSPFARWTPPSQRRGCWAIRAVAVVALGIIGFLGWVGTR